MKGTSQASARRGAARRSTPWLPLRARTRSRLPSSCISAVDALDSSGSLRRALTDPARPGHDKAELVEALFGSFDSRAVDVLKDFVHARWSADADLAESIEDAGGHALFAYAEVDGQARRRRGGAVPRGAQPHGESRPAGGDEQPLRHEGHALAGASRTCSAASSPVASHAMLDACRWGAAWSQARAHDRASCSPQLPRDAIARSRM